MFSFKYSKKIDKECWNRIIQADTLFGHKFPKSFLITDDDIKKAKSKAKFYQKIWNQFGNDFEKSIKKIYGFNFPQNITCYVNTSPYSMDGFPARYISISMNFTDPKKIKGVITHEASHYMFRKHYTNFCKNIKCTEQNIEDIKEVLTVINPVIFDNIWECGWKIHKKQRQKAFEVWKKTNNIKKVIESI